MVKIFKCSSSLRQRNNLRWKKGFLFEIILATSPGENYFTFLFLFLTFTPLFCSALLCSCCHRHLLLTPLFYSSFFLLLLSGFHSGQDFSLKFHFKTWYIRVKLKVKYVKIFDMLPFYYTHTEFLSRIERISLQRHRHHHNHHHCNLCINCHVRVLGEEGM